MGYFAVMASSQVSVTASQSSCQTLDGGSQCCSVKQKVSNSLFDKYTVNVYRLGMAVQGDHAVCGGLSGNNCFVNTVSHVVMMAADSVSKCIPSRRKPLTL